MLRTYPISERQAAMLATKVYAAHKAKALSTKEAYKILNKLRYYNSWAQNRKIEKWVDQHYEELGYTRVF